MQTDEVAVSDFAAQAGYVEFRIQNNESDPIDMDEIKDISVKVYCEATGVMHDSSLALKQLEEMDRLFMLTQTKS